MFSIIISSYKNPKYLKACIESILKAQKNKNEIIIVIDGFSQLYKEITEKFKDDVNFLILEDNVGMASALNYGVYSASNEYILIASEDNIFPDSFDEILENFKSKKEVYSIQQIEPFPSMYKYIIKDYGNSIETFQKELFYIEEPNFRKNEISEDGAMFPFFINKELYMCINGFDIAYNSPHIVDWDFFYKLQLLNIGLFKLNHLNFYHFGGKSTKFRNGYIELPGESQSFYEKENKAADYFEYKWGFKPYRDKNNKCKQFLNF
jgi:GT2 family glycosyltransferase